MNNKHKYSTIVLISIIVLIGGGIAISELIPYSSVQCTGTDKLSNVSFNGTNINGVCTADQTGGASSFNESNYYNKTTIGTILTGYNNASQDYTNDSNSWYPLNSNPRNYINTTTSSNSLTISDLIDTQYYFKFQGFESVTAGYTIPWVPTAIASGTANLVAGLPEHPSITDFRTHATINNSGYAFQIAGITTYSLDTNYTTQISFSALTLLGNTATTNITQCRFGFQDIFTTAQVTDGVYFNITQINSTHLNITGVVSNNGIRNVTTTRYTIASGTWVTGIIYITSPTLATFTLNNGTLDLWTDSAGGVPTGVGRETSHALLCYNLYNSTSAKSLAYVDYVVVGVNRKLIR